MAKIVLVGAGSFVFGRDFIADIMLYPKLGGSTLMLMDVDKERLDLATAFARKLTEQNKLKLKIESTTDRREALDGADYVITSIRAGGWKAQQILREITMKHGRKSNRTRLDPAGYSADCARYRRFWKFVMTWKKSVLTPGCSTIVIQWQSSAGPSMITPRSRMSAYVPTRPAVLKDSAESLVCRLRIFTTRWPA